MKKIYLYFSILLLISCKPNINIEEELNLIAEDYVKLVLEVGVYDPYFVDAYYGPEEWQTKVTENKKTMIPSEEILTKIKELNEKLKLIEVNSLDENLRLRLCYTIHWE